MKKIIKDIKPIESAIGTVENSYKTKYKVGEVFTSIHANHMITYEVTEEDDYTLYPGIYSATKTGYSLILRNKELLTEPNVSGVETVDITKKIKVFLEHTDLLLSRGLLPKLGIMLHGPPGCGKTHSINTAIKDLIGKGGVAVYCDMSEASISSLVTLLSDHGLDKSIDKLFIIIEDLGGGEVTDEKKGFFIPSMTDLLSFLDGNSLPWKKLPTVILSTTNYPKNFLANIIDRPGRFDDVVEFQLPTGEAALAYAQSLDIPLSDFDKHAIQKGGLGLAHVKKALLWKLIYGESIPGHLTKMRAHSEQVKKNLEKKLEYF